MLKKQSAVASKSIPRYLMAALVTTDNSRLDVPPKLFTTRATSIPGQSSRAVIHMHAHTHTRTRARTHTHTHSHACIHITTRPHTHMHAYTHTRTCMEHSYAPEIKRFCHFGVILINEDYIYSTIYTLVLALNTYLWYKLISGSHITYYMNVICQ